MGLDVLDKVPPRVAKPNLVVDLSALAGEGAAITFREPRAPDQVMGTGPRDALRAGFAEFSDELLATILIMGACYVPDAGETGTISPARRLAKLARENRELFFYIANRFSEAFPMTVLGIDQEAEKNG